MTAIPPNVLAMLAEVAGLVLDDWALERGCTFAPGVRESTVERLAGSMERAAREAPAALSPLAAMPPDVLRRHARAWAEPALIRELDDVAIAAGRTT